MALAQQAGGDACTQLVFCNSAVTTAVCNKVQLVTASCGGCIACAVMFSHCWSTCCTLSLQVALPTDDVLSEDVLAAAGQDAAVLLELWRADMLLGVAEVVEGCNLVRVEHSVGMLFGVSHTAIFQTNLTQ